MNKYLKDNVRGIHETERFCTTLDRNIILSVETHKDGTERRKCQNIDICKNKYKCRHSV